MQRLEQVVASFEMIFVPPRRPFAIEESTEELNLFEPVHSLSITVGDLRMSPFILSLTPLVQGINHLLDSLTKAEESKKTKVPLEDHRPVDEVLSMVER